MVLYLGRMGMEAGTENLLNVLLELGTGQNSPESVNGNNPMGWGIKR